MAAEAVLRCAQRGMRYRDMAVIATEPAYELQLLRSMQRRGIPCFSDGAASSPPTARRGWYYPH